jgi:putative phosphoesterase
VPGGSSAPSSPQREISSRGGGKAAPPAAPGIGESGISASLRVVAVLSDTHLPRGSRRLPDECVSHLEQADLILHGGDFVTQRVLEELLTLGPLEAVHGNADEPALQASLPRERVVEVEDARIGMVHAGGIRTGREKRLAARFPGCAAVVYGHTHAAQVERHAGIWILNPGSPTERRRSPVRSFLLLRIEGGEIEPELVRLQP